MEDNHHYLTVDVEDGSVRLLLQDEPVAYFNGDTTGIRTVAKLVRLWNDDVDRSKQIAKFAANASAGFTIDPSATLEGQVNA